MISSHFAFNFILCFEFRTTACYCLWMNLSKAFRQTLARFVVPFFLSTAFLAADEGMWLFNQPPASLLAEKHRFRLTDSWMDKLRLASIRFNSGGSGAFISDEGLLISNHHVAGGTLYKLSTPERNLYQDGFLARNRTEEIKCPELELLVLISMTNVTREVVSGVQPGMDPEKAFEARRAAISKIEKSAQTGAGVKAEVVTLWKGAEYHLYIYHRYTDIRLVFAPEHQIAFFGGDPDNFEYPRFDLDVTLFRAYENDRPARPASFLKFDTRGVRDNELVFVSGHPGNTGRILTVAELEFLRDVRLPLVLRRLHRAEVLFSNYAARSGENLRRSKAELLSVQNSRKAIEGKLQGLLDPALMNRKIVAETAILKKTGLQRAGHKMDPWQRVALAQQVVGSNFLAHYFIEQGYGLNSKLFSYARTLVRSHQERAKPDTGRLREFSDSNKPGVEQALFAPSPIYGDFETLKLADSLTFLKQVLRDELVDKIMAGKSPANRAHELVTGCKLGDVEVRKRLYFGPESEVFKSQDPMIRLAMEIDREARAVRRITDVQDDLKEEAYSEIVQLRYKDEENRTYPDATFSLRLAYGLVKGYQEHGINVPFQTTIRGLYQKAAANQNNYPFSLPRSWDLARDRLNLEIPLNFVSTADIIGGNSGSPVVNRNGDYVGIIFDGNIYSLPWDYEFDETLGRATSVDARAIIEAMEKVYDSSHLVREILAN